LEKLSNTKSAALNSTILGCVQAGSAIMVNQQKFFHAFGNRIRELRKTLGYSQEEMNSFGFSVRHWQQIEAGRPITVSTLLRICEAFKIPVERLVHGLDRGIYRG
jgi:DNA-binding XRE family transcriptional regulator